MLENIIYNSYRLRRGGEEELLVDDRERLVNNRRFLLDFFGLIALSLRTTYCFLDLDFSTLRERLSLLSVPSSSRIRRSRFLSLDTLRFLSLFSSLLSLSLLSVLSSSRKRLSRFLSLDTLRFLSLFSSLLSLPLLSVLSSSRKRRSWFLSFDTPRFLSRFSSLLSRIDLRSRVVLSGVKRSDFLSRDLSRSTSLIIFSDRLRLSSPLSVFR
ncbi:hypothetical protein RF11_11197 [Thelohanellus kitauei]|uniref:Uncharacterized protein n=1 Tax=Thelohanellus kitauei TaxID=669202 RepID=A0A0C2JDD3_THEKT|nr:hypothetical protein RF11_11197 [Thelohanellus kitauei]